MEAISDWVDYKLTRCADKLNKKYNIERRLTRLDDKINNRLKDEPNLLFQIAFSAAGIWIAVILFVTITLAIIY